MSKSLNYKGYSLKDWCRLKENRLTKGYILEEWDVLKNIKEFGLTPGKITYASSKEVWWKCPDCGASYLKKVSSRTINNGRCSECSTAGTSFPEQLIYESLKILYPDTENRYKGFGFEVDIYIPSINLAIEYNGSYFHKGREEKDRQKREYCESHGLKLIVVRDDGDFIYPMMNDKGDEITVKGKNSIVEKQTFAIVGLILSNSLHVNTKLGLNNKNGRQIMNCM